MSAVVPQEWVYKIIPNRVASWQSKYRVEVFRRGHSIATTFADSKWGARRQAKAVRRNWERKTLARTEMRRLPERRSLR